MCGLCGVLVGRGHWTEASAHPDVFAARADPPTRQGERQQRVARLNRVLEFYGLSAADWGSSYVLRSRTGRTRIVSNLTELWAAARVLGRAPCDPLDPALLAHLAERR